MFQLADNQKKPGSGGNSDLVQIEAKAQPVAGVDRFSPVKNSLLRALLLALGWVAVILGVAGIALPVLPTTPFLLLAAACFLRSSRHFYEWLTGHPRLGPYLTYYLDGQGMPYRAKCYTLVLLWSTMLFSAWLVGNPWLTLLLLASGLSVSFYIGRMPVRRPDK